MYFVDSVKPPKGAGGCAQGLGGCARCIPTFNWKTHTTQKITRNHLNKTGSGFDEGLIAEAILGVRDCKQGLFYLVKWKGRDDLELTDALITITHAPALVLHFYAERISWMTTGES